ncbi:MAG: hypothetical protein AAF492_22325, partial [Verrucomicrobiota bacterium]
MGAAWIDARRFTGPEGITRTDEARASRIYFTAGIGCSTFLIGKAAVAGSNHQGFDGRRKDVEQIGVKMLEKGRMQWLIAAGFTLAIQTRADVSLPRIFGNQMVIQRETRAPIWGRADPGERVTVTGSWGAGAEAVADADGRWRTGIDTPGAGGPFTMVIKGKNLIRFSGVLAGEVWVCSGQSNMQLPVNECRNSAYEISKANYPQIRLFQIKRVPSHTPLDDVEGSWAACSPDSVKNFSGTGYFFGRKLYKELGVPIGLVLGAWGATTI